MMVARSGGGWEQKAVGPISVEMANLQAHTTALDTAIGDLLEKIAPIMSGGPLLAAKEEEAQESTEAYPPLAKTLNHENSVLADMIRSIESITARIGI